VNSAQPPAAGRAGAELSGSAAEEGRLTSLPPAEERAEAAGLREGWRLYGQGDLQNARRVMMPGAAKSPDDPEPAYLLGMIFKAQGDRELAIRAFTAVTRTVGNISDPTRAAMIRRLAQTNLELLSRETRDEEGTPR
jgi:Flp pilus assembly protein TadD